MDLAKETFEFCITSSPFNSENINKEIVAYLEKYLDMCTPHKYCREAGCCLPNIQLFDAGNMNLNLQAVGANIL